MPAVWTNPRTWTAGELVTASIGNSAWRDNLMYLKDSPTFDNNVTITGTLTQTGVATLTAAPVLSALTASSAVFTNGSKALVSNAITGSGNVVMSASPTLTGTIVAAALTASGLITGNGGISGTTGTFSSTLAVTGNVTLTTINTRTIAVTNDASAIVARDGSGNFAANIITANLTGNVTGNVSGTAATVTGATQASITTCANLVTVGALNSGSITSGFGSINIGTDTLTAGAAVFDTDVLVVDATNNRVGIGTASPSHELEIVNNDAGAVPRVNLSNSNSTGGPQITLTAGSGAGGRTGTIQHFGGAGAHPDQLWLDAGGGTPAVVLATGSAARLTANSTGTTVAGTLTAADNVGLAATKKLYLDGVAMSGDTYLTESSGNVLDLYAGGANTLRLNATGATVTGTLAATGAISGTTGTFSALTTVSAGGLKVAGSVNGYNDELTFTSTGSGAQSGITSAATGAGVMNFAHLGSGNTGSWNWWNGTNATSIRMSLSGAGLLTVSGFGTHSFDAGGTGANRLGVRNSTDGAGNYAALDIGTDAATNTGTIQAYTSSYTESAYIKRLGIAVVGNGAGGVSIAADNASGVIRFYSGGTTERMRITSDGVVEIYGNTTIKINSSTNPIQATSMQADTGTALILTSSGIVNKQSSSRRYKEVGDNVTVSSDALAAFIALAPKWWDYTGQRNGAAGFIAEDLASLPVSRYGASPLVNYNADGQPESNRDYAIIGLQHLVLQQHNIAIQQLAARLAALEEKQ